MSDIKTRLNSLIEASTKEALLSATVGSKRLFDQEIEIHRVIVPARDKILELEAKLAIAIEALQSIAVSDSPEGNDAIEALQKIKGEKA